MKKVATQANVSISTVSIGVNQSGYAASNVRENVLRAMKRLNYQPSAMIARGLRRRSSESIGVLVPQLAHPFFGAIGIAIEKLLGGKGRIPSVVVGGLIIGTISNGLNMLNIQTFYQLVVVGSLIIAAVSIDRLIDQPK
jgi:ABC-type xylose transport system permease subunit